MNIILKQGFKTHTKHTYANHTKHTQNRTTHMTHIEKHQRKTYEHT